MTDLFTAVLNMSITASYVALAAIAARMLLIKAPKIFSYVLWLPVFIRLVCPFSFNSAFSFLNFLQHNPRLSSGAMEYVPYNIGFMQDPAVDVGIGSISNAVNSSLPPAAPMASANPMQVAMGFASNVWIVGVSLLLIYSIVSYLKVMDNVKTATLVRDNIFEADRITTPFVCGFIRPKIIIPAGMSENELSYILAHEQTHIKRLDYLVKPFAFLALIFHWFNPLMWLSFALMSKDMEMSCDESVLKKLGNDIKGSYSNSLLSLSVKRSGLLMGSPLAFGESNIKSRIKNILAYKKPKFWVVAAAIVITAVLIVSFTANPKNEDVSAPITYPEYDAEVLIANKTPYVGNNSKVVALIDALPLPAGIVRGTVELHTANQPYEITINLVMTDASDVTVQGVISGDAFYRNSILLFSLIDNVDIINCKISDNTGKYDDASYTFTYTREMTERLIGEDVRSYAGSAGTLKNLIDRLNGMSFDAERTSKDEQKEIKLPDFKANVSDPIEQLVYDAAVKQYSRPNDGFTVVAPTIFGSYEEGNKLKVFVTVFNMRYRLYGKTLSEVSGGIVPAAITFTKNADGSYTLDEYLEAMDGSFFPKSIKEYCVMPVSKKEIRGLSDKILDDYGDHKNRSELLMENLVEHLKSNDQKGIILKRVTDELVPLT